MGRKKGALKVVNQQIKESTAMISFHCHSVPYMSVLPGSRHRRYGNKMKKEAERSRKKNNKEDNHKQETWRKTDKKDEEVNIDIKKKKEI